MWREEKGKNKGWGQGYFRFFGGGGGVKLFMEKFRVGNSLQYTLRVVQFVQRG